MPDITLSVTVSRTGLGLSALEINDHLDYYIAPQFLGANAQWNRTQVTSPFLDGSVTTQRYRQTVNEQLGVEVLGASQADLQAKLSALLGAFFQDSFTITITVDGTAYAYACEAADYQVNWNGPRFIAAQVQVVFSVPRSPAPVSGGV